MIEQRLLHIIEDPLKRGILASDNRGIVYLMNHDLQIIDQSPKSAVSGALFILTANTEFIYGRDLYGNILSWKTQDLHQVHLISTDFLTLSNNEDEYASIVSTPSNGLHLRGSELIATNSRGELVFFDAKSMQVNAVKRPPVLAFIESYCTDGKVDVISSCASNIFIGDLSKMEFTHQFRSDHGNAHCLMYDQKWNRFWVTTDTLEGVCIFNRDGVILDRVRFTHDDTEWLAMADNGEFVFAVCFDHHVYKIKNEEKPFVVTRSPRLEAQVLKVVVTSERRLYVLLENGQVVELGVDLEPLHRSIFKTNAVWGIDHLNGQLYCALESGEVKIVRLKQEKFGRASLRTIKSIGSFGFGRIRRAFPLSDESFLGISTSGVAFRSDQQGQVMWKVTLQGILRDVTVMEDSVFVASESGQISQLNIHSGEILSVHPFKKAILSVYAKDRWHLLVGEQHLTTVDKVSGQALEGTGKIHLYNFVEKRIVKSIDVVGNTKRIRRLPNNHFLVNGSFGVMEISDDDLSIQKKWKEWILNTCENAIVLGENLHCVSYGYQLNSYVYESAQILGSQMPFEDYPKALWGEKIGANEFLLVGGRGFLSLFQVVLGEPKLLQTVFI